jgi:hypothetical protein
MWSGHAVSQHPLRTGRMCATGGYGTYRSCNSSGTDVYSGRGGPPVRLLLGGAESVRIVAARHRAAIAASDETAVSAVMRILSLTQNFRIELGLRSSQSPCRSWSLSLGSRARYCRQVSRRARRRYGYYHTLLDPSYITAVHTIYGVTSIRGRAVAVVGLSSSQCPAGGAAGPLALGERCASQMVSPPGITTAVILEVPQSTLSSQAPRLTKCGCWLEVAACESKLNIAEVDHLVIILRRSQSQRRRGQAREQENSRDDPSVLDGF